MRHLDLEVVVAGRWTPKDVKAASVARLISGDDVSEIAHDAGVAPQTVYDWVKQAGALPPKTALTCELDQRVDEALALMASGMSVPDAAASLGMPRSSLYRRLAKAGVLTELQQKPRITAQQKEEAVGRVLAGAVVKSVADGYGVSTTSVYRWVSESRRQAPPTGAGPRDCPDTPSTCQPRVARLFEK